jgi:hypothetical protein
VDIVILNPALQESSPFSTPSPAPQPPVPSAISPAGPPLPGATAAPTGQ